MLLSFLYFLEPAISVLEQAVWLGFACIAVCSPMDLEKFPE